MSCYWSLIKCIHAHALASYWSNSADFIIIMYMKLSKSDSTPHMYRICILFFFERLFISWCSFTNKIYLAWMTTLILRINALFINSCKKNWVKTINESHVTNAEGTRRNMRGFLWYFALTLYYFGLSQTCMLYTTQNITRS